MDASLLAVDCGTQSLRALLFDPRGELLEMARIEYIPYVSQKPGWAEQNPEIYWRSLCQACALLKQKAPQAFSRIAGMGVTAQRNTLINADENGDPLRPAITWLDQRKARPIYQPRGLYWLAYSLVGMTEAIAKVQADAKCNWVCQQQPGIWEKTAKCLQVSGFLTHRLCGQFKDSLASQIGHFPFHYKKQRWARPPELSARLFPIPPEKLPETVQPGQELGAITREAARRTSIPVGTPVIACGSDKGCETLGMGVLDTDTAGLSFGTTATVQTSCQRYCEPLKFMPAYPAPIPGWFNPEVEIFRGYWMITWFKNEFAPEECQQAKTLGIPAERLLDGLLERVPPGSMGLMVQPYWSPGLKCLSAKGAMIGFGDLHTRAHVYRAVIEGLGYTLKDGLLRIERACGSRVRQLAVSGGASQSDAICQITADVFDLPLRRGKTHESAGLGAAMVIAAGLGLYPDVVSAARAMRGYARQFEPHPENARLYARFFHRVYQRLYPALDPLYKEIREITGFPQKV